LEAPSRSTNVSFGHWQNVLGCKVKE
jgi:hypothetical protein